MVPGGEEPRTRSAASESLEFCTETTLQTFPNNAKRPTYPPTHRAAKQIHLRAGIEEGRAGRRQERRVVDIWWPQSVSQSIRQIVDSVAGWLAPPKNYYSPPSSQCVRCLLWIKKKKKRVSTNTTGTESSRGILKARRPKVRCSHIPGLEFGQ